MLAEGNDEPEPHGTLAALITPLVRIPDDSNAVVDADEEIFLLYTDLQRSSDETRPAGLGYVDSRQDTLIVKFELHSPSSADLPSTPTKSKKGRSSRKHDRPRPQLMEVEFELAQDRTALRSRKGDTGSVLWRISVELTRLLLQQRHDRRSDSLLDYDKLVDAHVLELGAGTGLLSIALSTLARKYTVTDIADLLPLIRKNVDLNHDKLSRNNVFIEELDWQKLKDTSPSSRSRYFSNDTDPPDLLLVVDCIYHPSLLPALVETIDWLAVPEKTSVLVAGEMRAEDVLREFLELWIGRQGWEIARVGGKLFNVPYVVWAGLKRS